MQRTKYGLKDDFMNDISFNVSSYTFGCGAGFKVAHNIKLNVAYFWTNYETYDRVSESYNNIPAKLAGMGVKEEVLSMLPAIPGGKDSFTRTNKVFGIGIDYTF